MQIAAAGLGVADFDLDGSNDLAIAADIPGGGPSTVRVLYGPLGGYYELGGASVDLVGTSYTVFGQATDATGDGVVDLLLGSFDTGIHGTDSGAVYLLDGTSY